jgi:hypothetical protein
MGLVGKVFGRMTVVREARARTKTSAARYECLCSCGTTKEVCASNLWSGDTKSCGCLRRELSTAKATAHSESANGRNTKEYRAWQRMLARCYRQTHERYEYYGGRGISVCDRWRSSYEAFRDDMGPCPRGHSLDRKDANGNYEPGNCRWADASVQSSNKRPRSSTGVLGVYQHGSKFKAEIRRNGVREMLGSFDDLEEAAAARKAAEARVYPEYTR